MSAVLGWGKTEKREEVRKRKRKDDKDIANRLVQFCNNYVRFIKFTIRLFFVAYKDAASVHGLIGRPIWTTEEQTQFCWYQTRSKIPGHEPNVDAQNKKENMAKHHVRDDPYGNFGLYQL